MRKRHGLSLAAALGLAIGQPAQSRPAPAGPTRPHPSAPQLSADLSPAQLIEALGRFEEGQWIRDNAGPPRCGVRVVHYEYLTRGGAGEPATASAALMEPTGHDPVCTRPHAIVVALHGTVWDRAFNLADLANPATPGANRALAWAGTFAARGYVVIAPNYVGFDTSSADYHPYLDYRQQTRDVVDAITAGRRLLAARGVARSGRLFLTGFSQGGWLALAVHRRLEQAGRHLTASMPSAGSYLPTALVDDIFLGRPVQASPVLFAMGLTAMRRAGVRAYSDPAQFFSPRYAAGIERLFPTAQPLSALLASGRLPATALFGSPFPALPPDAGSRLRALARLGGPAAGPEHLQPTYRRGIGSAPLITDRARLDYLRDMAANPDGAWPVWRGGQPARDPRHPLRRWYNRGDLRGWVPRAPVTMCGGGSDPVVPFRLGGELMLRYWTSPGTSAPAGRVSLLDFDDPAVPRDRYLDLRMKMLRYQSELVARSGRAALVDAYHTQVLPRFCYLAARQWFDTMR